jgi:hypothetical protein
MEEKKKNYISSFYAAAVDLMEGRRGALGAWE